MAANHGIKAKVLYDVYDVSQWLTSVSMPRTVETAQTQGFGTTAKTYVIGLEDAQLTGEGIYDGAASAVDAILNGLVQAGVQRIFSFYPNGDAIGNRVLSMLTDLSAYDVSANLTDAAKVTLSAQSSSGLDGGVSLHPLQAEVAPGTTASVDNGALTSNGGVAVIHATAATGSATLKVQHSADNAVWADLFTFTAVTGPTTQRAVVAAATTVNRYLRDNHTPGTTVTFAMHFTRR